MWWDWPRGGLKGGAPVVGGRDMDRRAEGAVMGHLHLAARSPALRRLASGVRQIAQKLGFDVVRHTQFPADFDAETADIIGRVTPYTKTTPERLFALCEAIRYLERYDAKIHYVVGRVEDTIPREAPDQIALLRLDTDWYDSTKHELKHLFPRLSRGGVLLIDDYGWWLGARQAVDEYLAENHVPVLLNRMGMGRICVVYDKGLAERGHNGAV